MVDAVSSASVVKTVCDTTIQWDCKLPELFKQIEQARFVYDVVTPVVLLTCVVLIFFVPLFLLSRAKKNE